MCELRSKVSEVELLSETKRKRKKKRKNEVARKELKDGALTRTDITFGPKVNIKGES